MAKPQVKSIGKYVSDRQHLGDCIGKGAFGKVYRGLNTETGQTVAIKQLSLTGVAEDKLKSIHKEINLLKKLNHKYIVKYIGRTYADAISSENHLCIVLEYAEGGSLAGVIKKHKPLKEGLISKFVRQVLIGLAYLHAQGVVHRDIKGANILLTKDGEVKLADFGVATKLTETVKSMSFAGTPYWMAPEIVENGHGTAACDIWSLGCTVIELLTGSPPYYDLDVMPALYRLMQDDHPPLPAGISSGLTDFLLACFQKEPLIRVSAENLLSHKFIVDGDRLDAGDAPQQEISQPASGDEEDDAEAVSGLDEIKVGSLAVHRRSIAQTNIAEPPLPTAPTEDHESSDDDRKSLVTVVPQQSQEPRDARKKSSRSHFSKSTRMTSDELSPLESPRYREKSFSDEDSPKTQVQVVSKKEITEIVRELHVLNPRLPIALVELTAKMQENPMLKAAGTECFAHLKEILEETESAEVELLTVRLLRCITADSEYRMTVMASLGMVPALFRSLHEPEPSESKRETALLISELLHQSERIREFFLAAGGAEQLPLLFVDSDQEDNQDLLLIGLDCMKLLLSQTQFRDHLLTIWARNETIDRLLLGMDALTAMESKCEEAARLLKKFSKGPKSVMERLADSGNVDLIVALVKGVTDEVRKVLVEVVKNMCAEHSLHAKLENAGLIPELVSWLRQFPDLKKPLLLALTSLCRLSAARQEQAALAGLVSTVLEVLRTREDPYVDCSVLFLVGWISASPVTRKFLKEGNALDLLLNFLTGTHREKTLDGLSNWTMIDAEYCDMVLLRADNLKRIGAVLINGINPDLELTCLQRMLQSSERLCISLSKQAEFVEAVISRLNAGAGVNVEKSCLEVLLLLCSRLENPRELLDRFNVYPVLMKLLHVSHEEELVVLEECATMLLQLYSQN